MPTASLQLLVAGESFEDLIFAGLPRLPGPGEEIRTDVFTRTFGGGALITSAWARSLGLGVELLTALPPGAIRILRNEGIQVHNFRRPREPHAVTACLSLGAERSFATFPGVNYELEERLLGALGGGKESPSGGALLLALPPTHCPLWAEWQVRRRQMGVQIPEVFWDFGYDEGLPGRPGFGLLLASATGIFVNEQEAALYDRGGRLLSRAAENGTLVVVKLGAGGATVLGQPETTVAAPIPIHGVRDTTGAGDAFAAGFLARRLRGGTLTDQLAAGNVCGVRSVQRLGGLPERPWKPPE